MEINSKEKYYTPDLHLNLIMSLVHLVGSCLDQHKIKWWAEGGTLLGAVRHKNIIPWDDDADIGVENRYWRKILPALETINNVTISMDNQNYEIKVLNTTESLIKVYIPNLWVNTIEGNRIIGTPTLDIFRYRINDDIVELYDIQNREKFPNSFFRYNELFPLKEHQFGKITVRVANDPMPYVQRLYGIDCLKKCKIDLRRPTSESALEKDRESIEFDLF
jgi:phosphorylcholine metabolism protein LicD